MTRQLTLSGKVEPHLSSIEDLYQEGFNNFEMYLSTDILDNTSVKDILETCDESPGTFTSVHTPHVDIEQSNCKKYYEQTDRIADELDSVLVFDSNPTSIRYAPIIYPPSDINASKYGYENDPSVSSYYLETTHLGEEYPIVLDTAHIHMSDPEYVSFIEKLLENYESLVPEFHLADAIRSQDGLAFGEGTVPIEEIVNLLQTYEFSGPVVLETSQDTQPDALEFVKEIL